MTTNYYRQPVPHSRKVFLSVSRPLKLHEPLTAQAFEAVVGFVARKAVVARGTVRTALGGPQATGMTVIDGILRASLDPRLALAEAGYDAVEFEGDGSIQPLGNQAEYDPNGSLRLSEYAVRQNMIPVYRVGPEDRRQAIASATRVTEATGALRSSPTEQPPLVQDRLALSQCSTSKLTLSDVTPLTSSPSTNLGSSTTDVITNTSLPPQHTPLRIGDRHPATGRPIYHESDDLADVMDRAKSALPYATEMLKSVAGKVPGAKFFAPEEAQHGQPSIRAKTGMERIREKLSGGRAVSNMSDMLGGRIWVDHADQIHDVISQLQEHAGSTIPHEWDEDFTTGEGRGGYRARHVVLPLPSHGMSMEVQVMPKEIGEAQEEAHRHYNKFRTATATLADVIDAKQKSAEVFNQAYRRYVQRTTGSIPSPEDSLYGDTSMGVKQTDVSKDGNPLEVVPHGGKYTEPAASDPSDLSQQHRERGVYLNINRPADSANPAPKSLVEDAKKTMGLDITGAPMGDAYQRIMDALTAQGDPNPRDTLHGLLKANGIDGLRFKGDSGRPSWMPISDDQIYDPRVAKTQAGQLKMSEFAVKTGMVFVDPNTGEQIDDTVYFSELGGA